MSTPYVSLVVTARNDDHGENLLYRMGVFVRAFLEQARRHNLNAELILVEWNPPANAPRLHEALTLNSETGPCAVRVIEVPPELHADFRYADRLPLFQMIAKNVGIRRARGRFVLATNVDLLFSNELISLMSSEGLSSGFMYRIDRYDVPSDVPAEDSVKDQLDYCSQNVIRINTKDGTFERAALRWRRLLLVSKGIKLVRASFMTFCGSTRNYVGRSVSTYIVVFRAIRKDILSKPGPSRTYSMTDLGRKALRAAFDIERYFLVSQLRLAHGAVETTVGWINHLLSSIRHVARSLYPPYPKLHTNGCGDFTLMAREHWFALRGYPELEMFSFNLDSILCQIAYDSGVKERILKTPMRLYHIEHKSGWTPQTDGAMKQRLRTAGIPMLDFADFQSWATRIHNAKRPIVFNGEDWGLGSRTLNEITIRKKRP